MFSQAGINTVNKWFGFDRGRLDSAVVISKWNESHIDLNGHSVKKCLFGYDHIIEVDWRKIFQKTPLEEYSNRLWQWDLRPEFINQFTYPHCDIENHCSVVEMRGIYNDLEIFERNEFGDDHVFVGTNSEANALVIALKYK